MSKQYCFMSHAVIGKSKSKFEFNWKVIETVNSLLKDEDVIEKNIITKVFHER